MDYKYKRGQILGKRLKVPRYILNKVYNCTLSFNEFTEYELDDKIPISCIEEFDRRIVEQFGIEKARTLDWNLLNKEVYYNDVNFKDLLMSINSQTEDINTALYELAKDKIKPSDYTEEMKAVYSDRLFNLSQNNNDSLSYEKRKFNDGEISLEDLVRNWDLYKDKDFSYCLQNDRYNEFGITRSQLIDFMANYGNLAQLIVGNNNIYTFIGEITELTSEEKKKDYIKQFTDYILSNTYREYGEHREPIRLKDDEYREIFKYSSMEEYLKRFNEWNARKIMEELKVLPQDYVFNMSIPFSSLLNYDVLSFIGTYGLKNVVDFNNECGYFFTKNNCEMLKLMNDMYLHYGGNEHDPNKTIYTKNSYDENDNYVDRLYTKDEFYEAMRRMIIYGPSDGSFADKAPDYRDMTGEFRIRNAELFISEQAPKEFQKLFYTKSITPGVLAEHPEYIQYLEGKDLSSCLKLRYIQVDGSNALYGYENLYKFLGNKTDFKGVMKFITEYSDILDIIFDRSMSDSYQYEIKCSIDDNISQIQKKINESFRKIVIEKGIAYPKTIPQNLITNYPSMFLSSDSPKELQEAFYCRTIDTALVLSNPDYRKYLKKIDLEILYKYMPVSVVKGTNRYREINLISAVKQVFGTDDSFEIMLLYGKYIESIFEVNRLQNFKLKSNFSKNDLLDEMDTCILQTIIDGKIKYDENIPKHFKSKNPTMFLSENVSDDIRKKFYNREFVINDFASNPELLEVFGETNIVCGFSEDVAWMIPLFNDKENLKEANYDRLKIISAYSKIQDLALQQVFKEYVMEFGKNINIKKIEYVSEVLLRLSLSNSNEIYTLKKELAVQILNASNPIESLNKIEEIFIKNTIPTFGKIYSCFEILHPDFQGFDFDSSMVSPVLKKSSTIQKKVIIFSDLIKSSFGSNNRSVQAFLKNIEVGNRLYESIKKGKIQYDTLDESQEKDLITFSKILSTLYNNTMQNKKRNEAFNHTGDVISDISELSKRLSPDGKLNYDLGDRVIRMFCGFIGINTLEQAKEWIGSKVKMADERNRNVANSEMKLEQGDFIKGIGGITYLRNILQNGSVSKEFLGASARSDNTPLDTDVSKITEFDGTNTEKIKKTEASEYGPIYFVLKNDDRFITTRNNSESLDVENDMSKMEVFYTGVLGQGHYGIRTGFSSSEINYIVMDNYDERVGLEIAMNGFYIPVANKEGKIIFTPKEYDSIRAKMSGLSYYGENDYIFSENLVTSEIKHIVSQIENSSHETQEKRMKICRIIEDSLDELGLQLKTKIDGDLTEGFVELIDTGSTGRGTNKPGDGDFDFMMRLDKYIISNPSKIKELKQTILKKLERENSLELTGAGDFRLKGVQIDTETNVDIDITFTEKTDTISYSTDMALQDRLSTIQKQDPEKYKYVVANILLAKQVLKQADVYKPDRGEVPQGGLGGVGIENWILQNGGSFIDATKSFIEVAEGKSFEEFKQYYYIWDFGENHLAERRGLYSHDNFITNNMSELGYQKMVQVLKEYVRNYSKSVQSLIKESLEEQKDVTLLDEIEHDQERQTKAISRTDNVQVK